MILAPDGSEGYDIELTGAADDALALGSDAGDELLARAGPDFVASLR
jgi:hydroxymethylbilane synthase